MKKKISHRYFLIGGASLFVLPMFFIPAEEGNDSNLLSLLGLAMLVGMTAFFVGLILWVRNRSYSRKQNKQDPSSKVSAELKKAQQEIQQGNISFKPRSLYTAIATILFFSLVTLIGIFGPEGLEVFGLLGIVGLCFGLGIGMRDSTTNGHKLAIYKEALTGNGADEESSKTALRQLAGIGLFIIAYIVGRSLGLLPAAVLAVVIFYFEERNTKKQYQELCNSIDERSTTDLSGKTEHSVPNNEEDEDDEIQAKIHLIKIGYKKVNGISVSTEDLHKMPEKVLIKYYKIGMNSLEKK